MKKLLLTLTFIIGTPNLNFAQFGVNLERINSLATDQNNYDFYFKNLKDKFSSNPIKLDEKQIAVLYYQPLNVIGSLNYNILTNAAYQSFKELNFKNFINQYEVYLNEMPANLSLLFLLSFAYDSYQPKNDKSDFYTIQFKQVIETLILNKSLRNLDNLIELNSDIDELILMQVLGIDEKLFDKSETFDELGYIHTYKNENDSISFKILTKEK